MREKTKEVVHLCHNKLQRNKKMYKKQNGITLIALVISIIVMLILAGVSLNATIGENGIITQAKNTTYMQSIAVLEEYLQTKYVKYYEDAEEYTNKVELLTNKINDLCLKDGTKKYFTIAENDKLINHYLINKQALPEEIKSQLNGGNTTEYEKCMRLEDVYGVTPDLKVYYCSNGRDSLMGTATTLEVNPNTLLVKTNQDAEIKKLVNDTLTDMGITSSEDGITIGNVTGIQNIEVDGSKYNVSSISAFNELPNLKKITLKDVNLNNLDGIEGLVKLNYIYFKNCQISDYSKLCSATNLKTLYIYLPPTMSQEIANNQITNLGNGLKNANNLSKLTTLGISGVTDYFERSNLDINAFANFNSISKLSDISGLDNISSTIKNSVTRLYLNHTNIQNINALSGFNLINRIDIEANILLTSLNGLENHSSITSLNFQHCRMLNSLDGLSGCTGISYIFGHSCSILQSLNGLEDASNIKYIYMPACDLVDLSALTEKTKLGSLYIGENTNLVDVSPLGTLIGLKELSLASNTNMDAIKLRDALADPETHIAKNCGGNFAIPQKYLIYFMDDSEVFNFKDYGLTDASEEINALKFKTSVTKLVLSGNNQLSDAKLQEILSTMTGLKSLSLYGCSNLKSIDFIGKGKAEKIVELDLRGTSTELTDLSNLNTYAKNLNLLLVDNPSIKMSKIVPTIKVLSNTTWGLSSNSLFGNDAAWRAYGLQIDGNLEKYSFEGCSEITNFRVNTWNKSSGILNLSGLVDATKIHNGYVSVKYPKSVKRIYTRVNNESDFSLVTNLEYMDITVNANSEASISNFISKMGNLSIDELMIDQTGLQYLKTLGNLKVSKLTFTGNSGNQQAKIASLKDFANASYVKELIIKYSANLLTLEGIEDFSNLEYLEIYNCKNLSNITGLSSCTKLTEIYINNTKVGDISEIGQLNLLQKLYLGSNNIADISSLANLTKITELELASNNITDLKPLESIIVNGKIGIVALNISNNLIPNMTVSGHNNIEILKNLCKAGVQTLNITNTEINDTGKQELKKVCKNLVY